MRFRQQSIIDGLKKKVEDNPTIGVKDSDGIYIYRKCGYIISYIALDSQGKEGKPKVEIISIKHKITGPERKIRELRKSARNFFRYHGWVYLLKPGMLLSFGICAVIIYLGVVEPYKNKVDRFKWITANILGISPKQLVYEGGLVYLFGKRELADSDGVEYVTFTFSPLNIFSLRNTGYIRRWSEGRGEVINAISFDSKDNIWIGLGDGTWRHGVLSDQAIKWDENSGSGNTKISGHKLLKDKDNIYLKDQ